MYYAGIGSRKTPEFTLNEMTYIAEALAPRWTLRSGAAIGADIAFELGAATKEIFYTNHCTNDAIAHAAKYHPSWGSCKLYVRMLHGRNSMIMLGQDLDSPVDCVICYTPNGRVEGGTGQAMRIAKDMDIPIYNLYNMTASEILNVLEDDHHV